MRISLNNYLSFMHRITMYMLMLSLGMTTVWSVSSAHVVALEPARVALYLEVFGQTTAVVSEPIVMSQEVWRVREWQELYVPGEWPLDGSLRYEIWDHRNRPIHGYTAVPLRTRKIDLQNLDGSLYTKLRFVVFAVEGASLPMLEVPVVVTRTDRTNTQLYIMAGLVGSLAIIFGVLAGLYRVGPWTIYRATRAVVAGRTIIITPRAITALIGSVVLWAGLGGLALGLYTGGVQVVYVMLKLPILLLLSWAIVISAIYIIPRLLSSPISVGQAILQSLSQLTVISVVFASMVPIFLYASAVQTPHVMTLWLLGSIVVIAGAFALQRWHGALVRARAPTPLFLTLFCAGLYLFVAGQMAWMLRPWLGVVDPISGTVPFMRLHTGSVLDGLTFLFVSL
jgi:uncharacterized membrane protein YobD (UPF0266 family)